MNRTSPVDRTPLNSVPVFTRFSGDRYSFRYFISFLAPSDLGKCRRLNKDWKALPDGPEGQYLWKDASVREGVPLVEGSDRNYREDFLFPAPRTLSSRMIARYLGTPVGEIPQMRRDLFMELKDSRDFFEKDKWKRDTHVVLVDPSELKITVDPDRPLTSDASGALTEVPAPQREGLEKRELTVPFSLKNLRMLAELPLEKRGDSPVFCPTALPQVLDQCNTPPQRNRIRIMRKEVVGKRKLFQDQIGLAARHGWGIAMIRERAVYDVIQALQTGTCSDPQGRQSYVGSSESFTEPRGTRFRAVIGPPKMNLYTILQGGSRTPSAPASFSMLYINIDNPEVGVVPVIDATVS